MKDQVARDNYSSLWDELEKIRKKLYMPMANPAVLAFNAYGQPYGQPVEHVTDALKQVREQQKLMSIAIDKMSARLDERFARLLDHLGLEEHATPATDSVMVLRKKDPA